MDLLVYRRPGGRAGLRNHLLILSTVVCANTVTERIARRVKRARPLIHTAGCCLLGADLAQFRRTLLGLATNPNVGAVLVVGLGCEQVDAEALASEATARGTRAEALRIQDAGGSRKAVAEGVRLARALAADLDADEREPGTLADLVLGTECGGSDFSSGLAPNPAIGWAADRIVEAGGTVILSETTEIIGGEHLLARRAASPDVADRLLAMVARVEDAARRMGVDIRGSQPTPGNIRGGLTTIEEKSLGCIYKAGTAPLEGVVEYAEPVPGPGLWFMDTPGQDVESITGMAAGGANLVVFSTGLGTPVGCPVAPVVKITGNPRTARCMKGNVDLSAAPVLAGRDTVEGVGATLLDLLARTAGGAPTRAERLGHTEAAIYRIGPTI